MSPQDRASSSSVEMLLLRDRLGLGRFRKSARRDPEKSQILLKLALDRIKKAERDNFIPMGPRKRRFLSSLKAKASL